jgi:hypothetical protein
MLALCFMNERDFFYRLQGFFEISESKTLSEKQVQVIKDHMKLVAQKVTPDRSQTAGVYQPDPFDFLPEPAGLIKKPETYCMSLGADLENNLCKTETSEEGDKEEPFHPLYKVPMCLTC